MRRKVLAIMADGLTPKELKNLRKQIDKSLLEPDYIILTNYDFKVVEIPIKRR